MLPIDTDCFVSGDKCEAVVAAASIRDEKSKWMGMKRKKCTSFFFLCEIVMF